jgi:hypothetical protein
MIFYVAIRNCIFTKTQLHLHKRYLYVTVIFMLASDPIEEMLNFAAPLILAIHLVFAVLQLTKIAMFKRALYGLVVGFSVISISIVPFILDIRLDSYIKDFWDLVFYYAVGTVISWEIVFQINQLIKKSVFKSIDLKTLKLNRILTLFFSNNKLHSSVCLAIFISIIS